MNWNDIEQSFKTETKQLLQKYSSNAYHNYTSSIPPTSFSATSSSITFPDATATQPTYNIKSSNIYNDDTNSTSNTNSQLLSALNSLTQKVNDLETSFQNKNLMFENIMLSQNESNMKIMKLENDLMRELHQSVSQQQLNFQNKIDSVTRQCDQLVFSVKDQPNMFVEKMVYNDDNKNIQFIISEIKRDTLKNLGLLEAFSDAFRELKSDWNLYTIRDSNNIMDPMTTNNNNSIHPEYNETNSNSLAHLYHKETIKLKQNIVQGVTAAVNYETNKQSEKLSQTIASALEMMTSSMQGLLADVTTKYTLLHQHVFELESKTNDFLHYKVDNTDIQDSLFKLTQSLQDQQTNQYHTFTEKISYIEEKSKHMEEAFREFCQQQWGDNDEFKKHNISHKISLTTHASRIHELENNIIERELLSLSSSSNNNTNNTEIIGSPPQNNKGIVLTDTIVNNNNNNATTVLFDSFSTKLELIEKELKSLQTMTNATKTNSFSLQQQARIDDIVNKYSQQAASSSQDILAQQLQSHEQIIQNLQNTVDMLNTRFDAYISVNLSNNNNSVNNTTNDNDKSTSFTDEDIHNDDSSSSLKINNNNRISNSASSSPAATSHTTTTNNNINTTTPPSSHSNSSNNNSHRKSKLQIKPRITVSASKHQHQQQAQAQGQRKYNTPIKNKDIHYGNGDDDDEDEDEVIPSNISSRNSKSSHNNSNNKDDEMVSPRVVLEVAKSVHTLQIENDDMKKVVVDIVNKLEQIESFSDARDLAVHELTTELKSQIKISAQQKSTLTTQSDVQHIVDTKITPRMTSFEASLQSCKQIIENFEQALSLHQSSFRQLETTIKSNEQSVKTLDTSHTALQTRVDTIDSQIKTLHTSLSACQSSQEALSDDVDELKLLAQSVMESKSYGNNDNNNEPTTNINNTDHTANNTNNADNVYTADAKNAFVDPASVVTTAPATTVTVTTPRIVPEMKLTSREDKTEKLAESKDNTISSKNALLQRDHHIGSKAISMAEEKLNASSLSHKHPTEEKGAKYVNFKSLNDSEIFSYTPEKGDSGVNSQNITPRLLPANTNTATTTAMTPAATAATISYHTAHKPPLTHTQQQQSSTHIHTHTNTHTADYTLARTPGLLEISKVEAAADASHYSLESSFDMLDDDGKRHV